MATPISIYGQSSISETVNVRGLNVCLKEAEWPCLYSTCEATYAQISFVFALLAKTVFCALRKICNLENNKSDKIKLVLTSIRMINFVLICAIKMLHNVNFLHYSTKITTPTSI